MTQEQKEFNQWLDTIKTFDGDNLCSLFGTVYQVKDRQITMQLNL